MKNKITFVLVVSIITVLCFFSVAQAQTNDFSSPEEAVINFHADIKVNVDNSVDVVETIIYEAGPYDRHGIYRDIDPFSSAGSRMNIESIEVVDGNNLPYMFEVSTSRSNVNIKIGDPEVTFTGQKTYIIKYHATKAVGQFKDFDEIYWNATGNAWEMPIYAATASVTLPSGVVATQTSCYYGPEGSTQICDLGSPVQLGIGEGLTIAAGFAKGVVVPYSTADKFSNFLSRILPWIIAGLLPILTLAVCLRYWHKKGRDPQGTGVIVPQYDVPDGLTPMEVSGIAKQKVPTATISAEIIYLATKGYLKITQIEERTLGIFKSTDYELTKLKDFSDLPNEFDKKLLEGLFGSDSQVKLSSLRNVFYTHASAVIDAVFNELLQKGYYTNLGGMKNGAGRIFLILFMSVWASGFLGAFAAVFFGGTPFIFMPSIFLSIVIYGVVSYFFPAKSEKGVAAKEYLLGLKDYLRIAEKDRLLFHNAPEKKPEIFEKLLPFAMVLGVANIWAKEFEGIYMTPPAWYAGSSTSSFNAIAFSNSMSSFSSFASSSLTSSPSSSGSGGGGSSGGGGGGGGGGGW